MKKLINPKVQFVVSTIFLLIIMFLSAYAIRVKADSEHQKSVLYGNKKIAIKEIKKTFADGINQYTKGDLSEDELNQYIASMITDKMEDTDAFTQKELTTIDTSIKNYLDINGVHKKIDKNTKSINDIYNLTSSIYENNLEYANKIESSLKDAIEKDKKDNTKTYSDLVEEDQLLISWINEVKTSANENKTNLDKIINNTTSWNENTSQNIGTFENRINSIESLINKNQEENLKSINNNAQDIKLCTENNQINNKLSVDNQKKISDIETSLNSCKKDTIKNSDELTKQNSIIEKNNQDILNKIDNTNNDISTKYGYLVNMMDETDDKNTKAISDLTDKTSLIETDYKKQISDLNDKVDGLFAGCVQRENYLINACTSLSGQTSRANAIIDDITSEDGDLAQLRAEDKSIRNDMDVMGKSLMSSISGQINTMASSFNYGLKYNRDEVEKELKDTNDIITQFKESEDKIDKAFREDINSILSELKEMKSKEDSDIISVKEDVTSNKNNIEKSVSELDKVVNKVSSLESTVNTNKQTQDKVNESINKKNSTQDKNIDTLIKQLGGNNFKILTEAEYQALVDNNKVDENTIYFIK